MTAIRDQLQRSLGSAYVLDREVGRGGMATVYLARDVKHDRLVALKVLDPDLGAVLGADRFLSEIRVTAGLQHPNLLPLFDSGEADGLLYYVMPYVEGETLRHRIDREKQLPIDEAVRIAVAVANALDYAHGHGVIHRDLKPANILLQHGQPVVADFGIALAVSNAGGARVTQTGMSLGTPQYMSPEQATGDRAIDARTDVYSLGAVTYEMLTGEPPHVGNTSQAIIARVLTETPRPLRTTRPNVPEHVEAAVACALEKIPADRFGTAKDFSDALSGRALARSKPSSGSARGTSRLSRRERWLVAAVGVLMTVLVTGAVVAWRGRSSPDVAPPLVRFTFETPARASLQLAVAPDGHAVAYVTSVNSRRTIVVRQLGSLALDTLRGTEGVFGPAWSPDSREIAFSSEGKLERIRLTDHSIRVVGDITSQSSRAGVLGMMWTSDSTIVFGGANGQLFRIPAAGGTPVAIKLGTHWRAPTALSADRILAVRHVIGAPDSSGLFALSLDGKPAVRITALSSRASFVAPDQLLFVRDKALFAQRFDPRSLRLEGEPRLIVKPVGENAVNGVAGFDVANNGTLVYSAGDAAGIMQLAWYSRSGTKLSSLGDSARIADVALSPDERWIAMALRGGSGGSELRTLDLTRNVSSSLTRSALNAVWTRDSRSVMYGVPNAGGLRRIRLGAPEDSLVFRENNMTLIPQDVLADGSVLMLGGDSLLLVLPPGPAAQPRAVATIPGITETRLSPDAKQIAYGSNQSGTWQVYVARYPAMDERRQISAAGGMQPRWSADGRELFFLDLQGRLMTAPLRTGSSTEFLAPAALFQTPDKFPSPTSAEWVPARDGRRFLFLESVFREDPASTSLTVVLNWPSMLKSAGNVHD